MPPQTNREFILEWLEVVSMGAAQIAIEMGAEDDEVALGDQFMAAGLESLASHGIDVRTKIDDYD